MSHVLCRSLQRRMLTLSALNRCHTSFRPLISCQRRWIMMRRSLASMWTAYSSWFLIKNTVAHGTHILWVLPGRFLPGGRQVRDLGNLLLNVFYHCERSTVELMTHLLFWVEPLGFDLRCTFTWIVWNAYYCITILNILWAIPAFLTSHQ
jgi:hypothetical protein